LMNLKSLLTLKPSASSISATNAIKHFFFFNKPTPK
jgi:hypothetical protein